MINDPIPDKAFQIATKYNQRFPGIATHMHPRQFAEALYAHDQLALGDESTVVPVFTRHTGDTFTSGIIKPEHAEKGIAVLGVSIVDPWVQFLMGFVTPDTAFQRAFHIPVNPASERSLPYQEVILYANNLLPLTRILSQHAGDLLTRKEYQAQADLFLTDIAAL